MSEHIQLKGLQSSLSEVHSYAENINSTGKISNKTGKEVPIQEVLSTLQNTLQKLDNDENEFFLSPKIAKDINTVQKYVDAHLENSSQKSESQKVQDIYNKISARLNIKPFS